MQQLVPHVACMYAGLRGHSPAAAHPLQEASLSSVQPAAPLPPLAAASDIATVWRVDAAPPHSPHVLAQAAMYTGLRWHSPCAAQPRHSVCMSAHGAAAAPAPHAAASADRLGAVVEHGGQLEKLVAASLSMAVVGGFTIR